MGNADDRYIYHDPDCNGQGTVARWIIDDSMPSMSRSSDLDEDGDCRYWGRIDSDSPMIPTGTQTWRIYCTSAWTDNALTITYQDTPTVQAEGMDSIRMVMLIVMVVLMVVLVLFLGFLLSRAQV